MKRRLCSAILSWWGFKIDPAFPGGLNKSIIAVVPHTSNWDFPLGLLVRCTMHERVVFVGKHSLFRFPFGALFRSLGGVPVDRSKSSNYVEAVVKTINAAQHFHLCISPEGTRKKVDRLKTGFYHMAKQAGIPIVLCRFDWGTRTVSFDQPFYPTNDEKADFMYIHKYFEGAQGCNPANNFVTPAHA
jgi:1-acyl-sn-glycerol-3-phosphate acyltransferase